tara:strand:- start:116 stop:487 length:372 start_codon:yes stop_codon:yes gene_type:complete
MPYKDYEKHKEQARINSKITHKKKQASCPKYIKRRHLRNWNEKMILWDEEEIYERYLKSTNCEICHIEYTGYRTSHTKNLDHDYLSKYPRFVCCHKCNHHLQKVDNMRYKVMLELHRYFKIHL